MSTFYNIDEQRRWNDLEMWTDGGHEWSVSFGTTENLWNHHIFPDLKRFRNMAITEIAPGHGRITQFLSVLADKLSVVDLNESCIQKTREKLGHHVHSYNVGDGKSLTGIYDLSQDLVFCFDSAVHMHANVIEAYIEESNRVLKSGGCMWIHHSNWQDASDLSFNNVAGRSMMTPEQFHELAIKNGFARISQNPIKFNPEHHWDGTDFISFYIKL